MAFSPIGKMLVIVGLALVGIGVLLIFAERIPFLGKLPGDISIKREHFRFYFPLATCLALSALLSLILWLLSRR